MKETSLALTPRVKAAVRELVPATGMVPGWEQSRSFRQCLFPRWPAGLLVPPLETYRFLPILYKLEPIT